MNKVFRLQYLSPSLNSWYVLSFFNLNADFLTAQNLDDAFHLMELVAVLAILLETIRRENYNELLA